MAYDVVKLLSDDDGKKIEEPQWHYIFQFGDADRTLCTGEAFGMGESYAKYKIKTVERKGITCHRCIQMIKQFQSVIL